MSTQKIHRSAILGSFLNYISFVLNKGTTFVSTIVLTRLLTPDDFGLMALGLFLTYLEGLGDFGVGAAYIYQVDADPVTEDRRASTAFYFNLVWASFLSILAYLAAPHVALFFHDSRLEPVFKVMGLIFVLTSLGNLHEARLRKNLQFQQRFIAEVLKSLAKAGVAITLALNGLGVWSLVYGQLAGCVVATLSYWNLSRWCPRWEFDPALCRSLLGYGGQITLMLLMGAFIQNLDYLLVGQAQSAEQLGLYTMAFRLPELVILNICCVISPALFPTYARLQGDLKALQATFLNSTRYIALICFPLGVGTVLITEDFVRVCFTERWLPIIPVMQVLAIYATVFTIGFNAGDIYKALGRPKISNKLSLLNLALAIPALWFAVQVDILTVAWAQVAVTGFISFLRLLITARFLKLPFSSIAKALTPPTLAVLTMAASLAPLLTLSMAPALRLPLIVMSCALAYSLALMLFQRQLIRDTLITLRAFKQGG